MSDIEETQPRLQVAVVTGWRDVGGPDLARVELRRLDERPFPGYRPGQHVRVAPSHPSGDDGARYFSLASSPHRPERLELYLSRSGDQPPEGHSSASVTDVLFRSREGTEVRVGAPGGRFCLHRTGSAHVWLVASGTGVAPFISMLRHARHRHEREGDAERRFTLLHGVRYPSDLGYRRELEGLAAEDGLGFVYVPTVSRAGERRDADAVGLGRVNDQLRVLLERPGHDRLRPVLPGDADRSSLQRRLDPDRACVYLCGNSGMIVDCLEALADAGFRTEGEDAQVITEDYW